MKLHTLIAAAGLALFSAACGSHEHRDAPHTEHEEVQAALRLNGTEKWISDVSTRQHVVQMQEKVQDYLAHNSTDHAALAEALQADLQSLTAGCTMQGPAHDELHKWLVPYIGQVKSLAKASAAQDARAQVKQLEEQLQSFHSYFE